MKESHIIDTRTGNETIVFFHGTPSSKHEYIGVIDKLKGRYRCIAIDMLGFGDNQASLSEDKTLKSQALYLKATLEALDVNEFHAVAGDFGGPISAYMLANSDFKLLSYTLFNTWMSNPIKYEEIAKASKIVKSPLGKFIYLYLGFSTNVLAKQAFKDKSQYQSLKKQLNAPFPNKDSRRVLYTFSQELTGANEVYKEATEYLNKLPKEKINILWGKGDKLLPESVLRDWEANYKVTTSEAGHFLPYEDPDFLTREIEGLIESTRAGVIS